MRILLTLLALLLVGLQIQLWTGAGSLAEVSRLNAAIEQQAADNLVLQERNQELLREVNELKTGLDAVEERARDELGLIGEGETFYLIVEGKSEE